MDPRLGARLVQRLGEPLDVELAAHVERCLACQTWLVAFARFDAELSDSEPPP